MRKTMATVILAALMGAGIGGTAVAASGPHEDSRNFNCAKHGNRQCGAWVDLTPNKPGGKVHVVLNFKSGKFTRR